MNRSVLFGGASTQSSDSLAPNDTHFVILSERSESKNLQKVGRSLQPTSSCRRLERSAHHRETLPTSLYELVGTARLARRHSLAQGDMSSDASVFPWVGAAKRRDGAQGDME